MAPIVFTGHMIDAADRAESRFPAGKENQVRQAILAVLLKEKEDTPDSMIGFAGGASGGDILFHELCEELGIPTEMFLALPPDAYKKTSVAFAGVQWCERFERLAKKLPVHILPGTAHTDIWEATNRWILHTAFARGHNPRILALWDGKTGDGSGGTEHLIRLGKQMGAGIQLIDITTV